MKINKRQVAFQKEMQKFVIEIQNVIKGSSLRSEQLKKILRLKTRYIRKCIFFFVHSFQGMSIGYKVNRNASRYAGRN